MRRDRARRRDRCRRRSRCKTADRHDHESGTGTTDDETIQYVLGDIFHSNPLVIGDPPNAQYFAYEPERLPRFAAKHRLRRKMLLVGGQRRHAARLRRR